MAAFAHEYRAPPGWSVDGLALHQTGDAGLIACVRSRLDGDDWVGALDLLRADTLEATASVVLECGAADVAWADGVIVVARDDGCLGFYDRQTAAAVAAPVVAHAGAVRAVTRVTDASCASTGDDGVVRRWDLREGQQLVHEHHGHTDACLAVTLLQETNSETPWCGADTIASGGRDGTVRIWDGRSPRAAAIRTFNSDVRSLTVMSDGERSGGVESLILVGLGDGTLMRWDTRQATDGPHASCEWHRFAPGAGAGALAEFYNFGEPLTGKHAAGSDDGSIQIVSRNGSGDKRTIEGHTDYCNALCWTDASTLVSGGRDGVVRSWKV